MILPESEIATTAGELLVADEHVITRRSVVSWVLYDLANTIFSMGIVSLFFVRFMERGLGSGAANEVYGFITAISMAVIFVVSPMLGAITDMARRRMPFLIVSTILCVAFTAGLGRGPWTLSMVLFILANIFYQAGLQFYDALLPDVSTEENRGKIGGIGVGIGYLGSFVAVILGFVVAHGAPDPAVVPRNPTEMAPLFTAVAAAFLLFALPSFFFVKERGNPNPKRITPGAVAASMKRTIETLKQSGRYPGLLRFLVGRMFYTDAINTVISMMGLYTMAIAKTHGATQEAAEGSTNIVLLLAITFAVIGGFVWGRLSDRIGPKRTLDRVLFTWFTIFVGAAAVGILSLPLWALFVVASFAGFSMGGIWAADRPLMLRLTPPARVGELYGLYGMVGRFSAITGPLIWGLVLTATNNSGLPVAVGQGIGILVLLLVIMIGYFILRPVTDTPRVWTGTDLER